MIGQKKVVGTIQARMTSNRLPGKVLMPVAGEPALKRMVERMKKSKYLDDVIVATTINKPDDAIVEFCQRNAFKFHRGSEYDVLTRILEAARNAKADIQVAITADCPFVDYRQIDEVLEELVKGDYDYVSNSIERSFPDGCDVQAFPLRVLEEVNRLTDDPIDRVHGTYYIYQHPEKFRLRNIKAQGKMFWPELGITLDEPSDYKMICAIYDVLLPLHGPYFSAEAVVDFLRKNPQVVAINQDVRRKKPQEG